VSEDKQSEDKQSEDKQSEDKQSKERMDTGCVREQTDSAHISKEVLMTAQYEIMSQQQHMTRHDMTCRAEI
jgi:hypothetical protein